jgi:UDP-glucose 4-epimerase
MRVVVTGGAGYIGSVVVEALVADGHDVAVIDHLRKGHRDAVVDAATFVEADLLNRRLVTDRLRAFKCDAVIHLAAYSLVGESMTAPGRYYTNNVVAGLALLEAMREAGVPRIVFSSTAAVYGEPAKQPIEETDPTAPTNPYGETKLAFEHALRWYAHAYGLSSISLRYFNAAGASERNGERHEPETHLIPLVLRAAAGLIPNVMVFGNDYPTPDGTCVRDYIHVEDLARAHLLAVAALESGGICRSYNLGCGGPGYSVREVIDVAEHVTGRTVPVEVGQRRPGDPAVLVASSERIRRDLGWSPRRQSLDAIVRSAWTWMQRRHEPAPASADVKWCTPVP